VNIVPCKQNTPSQPQSRMQFPGVKVLLAEDNPVNQEVAISMLDILESEYQLAENGKQVLAALNGDQFNIILMDCQMPEMDGFEAAAEIRRMEHDNKANRIPIIAVTANAMEGDREQCIAAGMDDYLSKPFSQIQLAEMLQRWCGEIATVEDEQSHKNDAQQDAGCSVSNEAQDQPDEPAIDQAALNNIRQLQRPGKPDFLEKIVLLYMKDSPGLLNALRDAIDQDDAEQVRMHAHRFRSGSANLGALRLAELCKQLEEMGRNNELQQALILLNRVEAEFRLASVALQQESLGGVANA
jgi:two-component system sensor histidine kinase/response regulator